MWMPAAVWTVIRFIENEPALAASIAIVTYLLWSLFVRHWVSRLLWEPDSSTYRPPEVVSEFEEKRRKAREAMQAKLDKELKERPRAPVSQAAKPPAAIKPKYSAPLRQSMRGEYYPLSSGGDACTWRPSRPQPMSGG